MERCAQYIERAQEIDVDHGLERVDRHAKRRGEEIAGCPGQDDVDLAISIARRCKGLIHGGEITHIGGETRRVVAGRAQPLRRRLDFFGRTADQRHFGTCFREAAGHAQIDAGGCTGDEGHPASQNAVSQADAHR